MSKTILIIEDEEDMVFAVTMQLEAAGFKVISAFDGKVGLDKARQQNPDLIILDLMIPKLNGYKLCRMLKFDEKYKKIPIILFTAKGRREDKDLGLEVGADAYVVKPFDSKILLDKIHELTK